MNSDKGGVKRRQMPHSLPGEGEPRPTLPIALPSSCVGLGEPAFYHLLIAAFGLKYLVAGKGA